MVTTIMKWCFTGLAAVSALAVSVRCTPPQTGNSVPPLKTITARMAQARLSNQARFRPYIVTRDYKMFGKDRQEAKSQVTADITFIPPDLKRYVIQRSSGSGLGEKIVRRILEDEVAVAKDSSSTDISADNYDFQFAGEEDVDGQRCYVLELLPRRGDKNLLHGKIWVDVNTYLLHRAEGGLAKNPSWWLRNVHVVLRYGDAEGMWLQTASEATANVHILGQATVVSQDVNLTIAGTAAARPDGFGLLRVRTAACCTTR